jgi:hypothetical protein
VAILSLRRPSATRTEVGSESTPRAGAGWRIHAPILAGYVLASLYVTGQLWMSPSGRLLRNEQDHIFFEWMFAHGARVVFHGEYPFITDRLNAPDGVNLIANTSILGFTVPMAPITALFGPAVSVAVLLTLGLAATAAAWYWVLSRHLARSRVAAAIGGAFCGFAPGMVSQAEGHPNLVAQFVVPFIVARLSMLGRADRQERTVRDGLILGLLVSYQAFINEEVLFFTALFCVVFVLAWAVQHRVEARARIRSSAIALGVGGVVAAVLLAYPLYVQFFGPQHYRGLLHGWQSSADLGSFVAFAQATVAGQGVQSPASVHPSEETTFLGWPLFILVVVIAVRLWHVAAVRALAVSGAVFAVLALGPRVSLLGHATPIPGPWALVDGLPLFTSVTPIRLGLVLVPVVGALLALATDRVIARSRSGTDNRRRTRMLWAGALAVALVPLVPLPLRPTTQPAMPDFITQGQWREYVSEGQTVVTVPVTTLPRPEGMWWAADQDIGFALAGGYFLGPVDGIAGNHAMFGAPPRPTAQLFTAVANSGQVPPIGPPERAQALADVRYWRAAVLVLDPRQVNAEPLRAVVTELFGPAESVGGIWLWDIR